MLSRETFDKGINDLKLAFDMNLNLYQREIWYKYLQKLTDDEFMHNIKHHIEFCNYNPYISDILNQPKN
ncbi:MULTISPECIES: hypothetical protein [Clostridium]|jgi:hypothetical protein|uniref:hypothetical protein n=1 Tax=Clostridium TaxID=1485 RepID=UPI000E8A7702|nr:hypothetical protein [Clostridium tyrobutyricum]HBF78251.1 hypothetical protein [Clostridiaceae bacterium]